MPPSRDIPFPSATPRRWPLFAAVGAVVVVGLLAVYEFGMNEAPRTAATAPAMDTPAAKTPPAQKEPASAPSLSTAAVVRPAAPANPPEAEVEAPVARQASPAPAATPPATATPPVVVSRQERPVHPDEREVRFVFEEESWVEVRDRNDAVIFYQLNASGTVRRVAGLPPLTVVVGNAQGVKMTYAGQPVDLTRHTKTDVARLTLE
jgi:cytoskeleton protein RodZ